MRAIKGNIGAEAAEKWMRFEKIGVKHRDGARAFPSPPLAGASGFFSSQGRRSKEDATSSGLAEKDLTFCANRFT